MHIVGNVVHGANARQPALGKAAQRGRQLVATGAAKGVPHIGLDGDHRPVLNPESLGGTLQNHGFGDPVLRCTGAVGVHKAVLAQALFADQLAGEGSGLAHSQVVAHAGSRDGFFATIGMDEHIRHGAENIGAQLQRQGIVHQHRELGGFRHGEATVIREGATGPVQVGAGGAVQGGQRLVFRQCAHGPVPFHDFWYQGGFAGAHNGDPHPAVTNGMDAFFQVIEESRAGAQHAPGGADGVQHIGIKKVGGHFPQPQWHLFGGDALAVGREAHDAAQAVVIHLRHGIAGIHGHLIRANPGGDLRPVHAQITQRITDAKNGHLQRAGMVTGGVERAGVKTVR